MLKIHASNTQEVYIAGFKHGVEIAKKIMAMTANGVAPSESRLLELSDEVHRTCEHGMPVRLWCSDCDDES